MPTKLQRAGRRFLLRLVESTPVDVRFERWCEVIGSLPRKQTRVLTWPLVTVFGYIARPDRHMFLKPV
jgi:hypothetical protein